MAVRDAGTFGRGVPDDTVPCEGEQRAVPEIDAAAVRVPARTDGVRVDTIEADLTCGNSASTIQPAAVAGCDGVAFQLSPRIPGVSYASFSCLVDRLSASAVVR